MTVLRSTPRHYEAGCTHEVAHRALALALDSFPALERVVGISGAGCGSLVHAYLELPFVASPFGRGTSVARGLLLARPEALPLLYVGDGELLGEGLADLIRASREDAPMVVVLIDNSDQDQALLPLLQGCSDVAVGTVEDLAEALTRALVRTQEERHFSLVRVRGSCPAQGRDA